VTPEPSESDLKAIWKSHTVENMTMSIMSIEELRSRARNRATAYAISFSLDSQQPLRYFVRSQCGAPGLLQPV
jgi:hypothetical protein